MSRIQTRLYAKRRRGWVRAGSQRAVLTLNKDSLVNELMTWVCQKSMVTLRCWFQVRSLIGTSCEQQESIKMSVLSGVWSHGAQIGIIYQDVVGRWWERVSAGWYWLVIRSDCICCQSCKYVILEKGCHCIDRLANTKCINKTSRVIVSLKL